MASKLCGSLKDVHFGTEAPLKKIEAVVPAGNKDKVCQALEGRGFDLARVALTDVSTPCFQPKLREGDVFTAAVAKTAYEGVYLDVPGQALFIHTTQLAKERVKPSEVCPVGAKVTAKVKGFMPSGWPDLTLIDVPQNGGADDTVDINSKDPDKKTMVQLDMTKVEVTVAVDAVAAAFDAISGAASRDYNPFGSDNGAIYVLPVEKGVRIQKPRAA